MQIEITLSGRQYKISSLTVDQISRMGVITYDENTLNPVERSIAILKIAIERARPEIADFGKMRLMPKEWRDALATVLDFAGLQMRDTKGELITNRPPRDERRWRPTPDGRSSEFR